MSKFPKNKCLLNAQKFDLLIWKIMKNVRIVFKHDFLPLNEGMKMRKISNYKSVFKYLKANDLSF